MSIDYDDLIKEIVPKCPTCHRSLRRQVVIKKGNEFRPIPRHLFELATDETVGFRLWCEWNCIDYFRNLEDYDSRT